MFPSIRIQMTQEQRAICDSTHPRIVVEANAGAAKTTTAAMKIAHLVKMGASPSKIVVLTFTETGVQAFRNVLRSLGIDDVIARSLRIGTFEDFCAARLCRLEKLNVARLDKPEEVRQFVLNAIARAREWAESRYANYFSLDGTGELAVEFLLNEFAHIKGSLQLLRQGEHFQISPACADEIGRDFTTLAIYRSYEQQRLFQIGVEGEQPQYRYEGDATYDLARILTEDTPQFSWDTHPLRLSLDAVILDEMHDTNWSMFSVLKELLAVNEDVQFLGVGDRDQVIHSLYGADSFFMGEGFDKFIGTPTRMPLTTAYRFGREVAQPLSRHSLKAYRFNTDVISRVEVKQAGDAAEVLALVNYAITKRPGLRADSPKSQLALLLRHPSAAADLEHELRRSGVRYSTTGFTTYLERPEVLFTRVILGMAVALKEGFRIDLAGKARLATWEFLGGRLKYDSNVSSRSIIENAAPSEFEEFLMRDLLNSADDPSAAARVREAKLIAADDSIESLERALSALDIRSFSRRVFVKTETVNDAEASISGLLRASVQYRSISEFLRSLHSHDYNAHSKNLANERITVSSIEAAKGLEFDHVIIPDVNSGDFDGALGDDKNLFYVAASRARHLLTLTHRPGKASSYLRHFQLHDY